MPRKKSEIEKTICTFRIEKEFVSKAQDLKLNTSEILRKALKRAVSKAQKSKEKFF